MSFNATIQSIRDGALLDLLTGKLTDVVASVIETGKGGQLTLTLKIKANGEGAVTISPDVKAKCADPTVGDAIFFATEDGTLTRRNPRQMDLEDEIARRRAEREQA